MTPTIAETAHAALAGADRDDDAKKLARWVLERVAEETADTERPPPGEWVEIQCDGPGCPDCMGVLP